MARLHGYLDDLLYREGKRTIQPLFQFPKELIEALGIDKVMSRTMKRIEESMKKEFETEFKEKGKKHYEKIAKDYVRRLEPRLQPIARMFEYARVNIIYLLNNSTFGSAYEGGFSNSADITSGYRPDHD